MTGYIDPTKETFAAFRGNAREGPIHMLNLVRLRALAGYPDGRRPPARTRVGGRIVWQGKFELLLIGPSEEPWDLCFIPEYPSFAAFVEMIRDPVYREAVKHRQAAVADSRLIRSLRNASVMSGTNPDNAVSVSATDAQMAKLLTSPASLPPAGCAPDRRSAAA